MSLSNGSWVMNILIFMTCWNHVIRSRRGRQRVVKLYIDHVINVFIKNLQNFFFSIWSICSSLWFKRSYHQTKYIDLHHVIVVSCLPRSVETSFIKLFLIDFYHHLKKLRESYLPIVLCSWYTSILRPSVFILSLYTSLFYW